MCHTTCGVANSCRFDYHSGVQLLLGIPLQPNQHIPSPSPPLQFPLFRRLMWHAAHSTLLR